MTGQTAQRGQPAATAVASNEPREGTQDAPIIIPGTVHILSSCRLAAFKWRWARGWKLPDGTCGTWAVTKHRPWLAIRCETTADAPERDPDDLHSLLEARADAFLAAAIKREAIVQSQLADILEASR